MLAPPNRQITCLTMMSPLFTYGPTNKKRLFKKHKQTKKKTYRSYWKRHPCLSLHVWALSKNGKEKTDPYSRALTKNLCNFRLWFLLLLGQKSIAGVFESLQEQERTRCRLPLPNQVWNGGLSKPCGVSTDAVGGVTGWAIACRDRGLPWLAASRLEIPTTERHLSNGKPPPWCFTEYSCSYILYLILTKRIFRKCNFSSKIFLFCFVFFFTNFYQLLCVLKGLIERWSRFYLTH